MRGSAQVGFAVPDVLRPELTNTDTEAHRTNHQKAVKHAAPSLGERPLLHVLDQHKPAGVNLETQLCIIL